MVPANDEWNFLEMEHARRSPLDTVCFSDIVDKIERQGRVVGAPQPERADNREAPRSTLRANFSIGMPAPIGDLLHNGRDGLRARYWQSPETGECATRRLLDRLQGLLFDSLPSKLEIDGFVLTRDAAANSLKFNSAKVWVHEKQLRSDGQLLEVPRWASYENEPDNPRMWKWTPMAMVFEIKSGWITPQGEEWVSKAKKNRSDQIHRWGFT
jgi:hypothetical protein